MHKSLDEFDIRPDPICLFCAFTRPRYQVSVYRTIGPLVLCIVSQFKQTGAHLFWQAQQNNMPIMTVGK